MLDQPVIPLPDRLRRAAQIWADAQGASLSRLGGKVLNDTSFFSRRAAQNPTTVTLERFARFLGDEAEWPEGEVPQEVRAFIHAVGVSPDAEAASPDIAGAAIAPAQSFTESPAQQEVEPSGRPPSAVAPNGGRGKPAAGSVPKPAPAAGDYSTGAAA